MTGRPAVNDNGHLFTMTRDELEELVDRAVSKALARGTEPPLVDKQALAQLLDCSPTHVDHLRKKGVPTVMVGNLVRFEPAKVLTWLRESGAA
jgi:hypothetical protein